MINDLINIKEKYGERMMHLCRKNFSTILENEGLLFYLMGSHFAYSRFLYEDIINNSLEDRFRNYIYSLLEPVRELPIVSESPKELFSMAGYDLYECNTVLEVNSFSKYYSVGEGLCTFRNIIDRLDKCYVFFAVRKDVATIKREDYFNPQRQDKYGTSVISIQFTKGEINTLSIKNRYNHSVSNNPDATFSNNLENIMPGLTKSFERDYGLNISQNNCGDLEIPGYVRANDGKFYKYNYEINGVYYCTDNIIIDNFEVIRDYQEKEKYIIIDYFIIDLVNKRISLYDKSISDSFVTGLDNIKKMDIVKFSETGSKKITVFLDGGTEACIEIDKCNRIVSYSNGSLENIGDSFLYYNKYLEKIDIPNVLRIGNGFLYSNNLLSILNIPKLLEIQDGFLCMNNSVGCINIPRVISIGNDCFRNNDKIESLYMSNLNKVGNNFMSKNKRIREVSFPNLILVGDYFLQCNTNLLVAKFPNLVVVGDWFISANKIINEVDFSKLREVGDNFLACNNTLISLFMSNLERTGNNFLFCNKTLQKIVVPKLMVLGTKCLYYNNSLLELMAPNLNLVGNYFLYMNTVLENWDFSSVKHYGCDFCKNNNAVRKRIGIFTT